MKKKGNHFEDYFYAYSRLVYRNAYYIVKDRHTAEDICQDTFERLLKNQSRIPAKKVKSWLIIVSERLALDYLKKGGKCQIDVGLEISEEFFCDIYSDPGYIVEKKEEREQKERVLERLRNTKPNWYNVIQMSFVERLDNTAIAWELGVTYGQVSQWKSRGIKWLSKEYKNRDG